MQTPLERSRSRPLRVAAKDYRPRGIGGAIAKWMVETPAETVDVIRNAVHARVAKVAPDPHARKLYAVAAVADAQCAIAHPTGEILRTA